MKIVRLFLAASLALAAAQAGAQRLPVPIVNHDYVVLQRNDGQPATAQQVRAAILAASQATGRKWTVVETEPGRLLATYHVRTHTVSTQIRYGEGRLSLVYDDSTNMKYAPGPSGGGVIHPFYNQWVQEFLQAIRLELAKS